MKWIIFFISFIVLSLSSLPCCVLEDIGENTLCVESPSANENDTSGDEPCSPFFNCGSCTGFAIQQNIEITFIQVELVDANLTSYQDLFKGAYQNPDFKPPKA